MMVDSNDYFAKGRRRSVLFGTEGCSVQVWADGLAAPCAICLDAARIP